MDLLIARIRTVRTTENLQCEEFKFTEAVGSTTVTCLHSRGLNTAAAYTVAFQRTCLATC